MANLAENPPLPLPKLLPILPFLTIALVSVIAADDTDTK
jgi:hypothetical protein